MRYLALAAALVLAACTSEPVGSGGAAGAGGGDGGGGSGGSCEPNALCDAVDACGNILNACGNVDACGLCPGESECDAEHRCSCAAIEEPSFVAAWASDCGGLPVAFCDHPSVPKLCGPQGTAAPERCQYRSSGPISSEQGAPDGDVWCCCD